MGACASTLWESDSRDICQRMKDYCFFACCKCCKGQVVIHATEIDGAETEDIGKNVKKGL